GCYSCSEKRRLVVHAATYLARIDSDGVSLRPHGGEALHAAPSEARDLNACAPSPAPTGHSRIACAERCSCSAKPRLVADALTCLARFEFGWRFTLAPPWVTRRPWLLAPPRQPSPHRTGS